jgi:thiosulfate/3-mercaptopyruvate sulfurtransferase
MAVFIEAKALPEQVRFIDTRFSLKDVRAGRAAYDAGHIAGAMYWDLNDDLSDLQLPEGRHPLPAKEKLQALFERSGLRLDQMIAIYDAGGEPFATRAYWLLRYAGFSQVYVVNGGFDALVQAGYAVVSEVPNVDTSALALDWNEAIYADRAEVKAIVDGQVSGVLLDAREAPRYRGEVEPIDRIAGRIPGARNYFWGLSKADEKLVVTPELEQTVAKDEPIVVYCGSGVTASPVYALLKEAGYDQVKLYVGSYSDWIEHFEVERSNEVES